MWRSRHCTPDSRNSPFCTTSSENGFREHPGHVGARSGRLLSKASRRPSFARSLFLCGPSAACLRGWLCHRLNVLYFPFSETTPYPTPNAGKTRRRPVSAPLNERMTGQGRNAATAGWCGPQPGTGEDSGQTGRTLDAAAAARASRRGSRGGLLTPAPRRLAGESGRAEGSALCPSPQGAERVASTRPGARCRRPARRYVTKTACVSYLYHVSYLYWYEIHDTRYRRPRYDPV